jgi:hypothetical protein
MFFTHFWLLMSYLLVLFSNIAVGQSTADTTSLRQSVNAFMEASDKANIAVISAMYDPTFENVRVADQGGVISLSRAQILNILQMPGRPVIPTQSTTIAHLEVIGDMGFVLLIRVKDLGNGWEPMFYSLVWRNTLPAHH